MCYPTRLVTRRLTWASPAPSRTFTCIGATDLEDCHSQIRKMLEMCWAHAFLSFRPQRSTAVFTAAPVVLEVQSVWGFCFFLVLALLSLNIWPIFPGKSHILKERWGIVLLSQQWETTTCKQKEFSQQGIVVHTFNTWTWEVEQVDLQEFKAYLVYIMISSQSYTHSENLSWK